jgi:hypothetical protein
MSQLSHMDKLALVNLILSLVKKDKMEREAIQV